MTSSEPANTPAWWTNLLAKQMGASSAGCWRCGALSEVLVRILSLQGYDAGLVNGQANGVDHVWVQIGEVIYDPTVGQFAAPVFYTPSSEPAIAEGERAMLTYTYMRSGGRCDWRQLREAVSEAIRGNREVEQDERSDIYTGHRMVEGMNYNSLDRIVTAFVDAALAQSSTPPEWREWAGSAPNQALGAE